MQVVYYIETIRFVFTLNQLHSKSILVSPSCRQANHVQFTLCSLFSKTNLGTKRNRRNNLCSTQQKAGVCVWVCVCVCVSLGINSSSSLSLVRLRQDGRIGTWIHVIWKCSSWLDLQVRVCRCHFSRHFIRHGAPLLKCVVSQLTAVAFIVAVCP